VACPGLEIALEKSLLAVLGSYPVAEKNLTYLQVSKQTKEF